MTHVHKLLACVQSEKNKSKQEIMSQKYSNNVDTFCFIYRNFTIVKNRLISLVLLKKCVTHTLE